MPARSPWSKTVAKVATAAARLVKPPPAPKPVCRRCVAFVIELSIATETVWLAFAPTWNEADEPQPLSVTIVSFAVSPVRSVIRFATVPLAEKP